MFTREKYHRARPDVGIRITEMIWRMENQFYAKHMEDVGTIVMKVGNREVNAGMD